MRGYANKINENATVPLRANDKQFFNKIWKKVEKLMRKDFES